MVPAGNGVVLRLREGPDGLDCGFGLPLLLSDGILGRARLGARLVEIEESGRVVKGRSS
jgi:hypothetical protein